MILLLSLLLAGSPSAPKVDLSGVWEMNKAKSQATPNQPDALRIKIENHGDEFAMTFRVVSKGNTKTQVYKYLVGQQTRNTGDGLSIVSNTEWDGDVLVVRSVANFGDKEFRFTDRWTLMEKGAILKLDEVRKLGTDPEEGETRVFEKKLADSWGSDK